jgi:hypothetical protein
MTNGSGLWEGGAIRRLRGPEGRPERSRSGCGKAVHPALLRKVRPDTWPATLEAEAALLADEVRRTVR